MDEKDVDQNFLSFEKMSSNDEDYLTWFKNSIYRDIWGKASRCWAGGNNNCNLVSEQRQVL